MSSRRSRRSHNSKPKYSTEDFELDADFDSYNNSNESLSSNSKRSSRLRGENFSSNSNQINTSNNKNKLENNAENEHEIDDEVNEIEEITRCICGSDDLFIPKNSHGEFDNVDPGFFIQCETCSVWQHGYCVGIKDEENAPEKYWCEQCKPENHTLFTDKYGIRRSKYDPNNTHNQSSNRNSLLKKGIKRKNGRFVSSKSEIESTDDQINSSQDLQSSNLNNESLNHDNDHTKNDEKLNNNNEHEVEGEEYEDEDGHKKKHRKRPSYNYKDYNYEAMLKKALEESARESGVVPEEVYISSNETINQTRETRHTSLRKTRAKSHDGSDNENNIGINNDNSNKQIDDDDKIGIGRKKDNSLDNNSKFDDIKSEKIDKKSKVDDRRRIRDSKRIRPRRNISATSASNDEEDDELDDNKSDQKLSNLKNSSKPQNSKNTNNSTSTSVTAKRTSKKEKKEQKPSVTDDKPFRANIPSARINMNEMTRRIFSIMDFVSNIQINLSNEEEFKNNLFKMDDSELTPEIVELKNKLIGCYNESVDELDNLTSLLNTWQGEYT